MNRHIQKAMELQRKNMKPRNPSMQNPVAPPDCKHCYYSQHVYSHDGGHLRCTADQPKPNPDNCTYYIREAGSDD